MGLSAAELDGFHKEQHGADEEVAAQGEHAESGAGRPCHGLPGLDKAPCS